MLTQRQVQRVIGRARLDRLLKAGWIKPPHVNGRSLEYDEDDIRHALKRLERGYGFELNGYAHRPMVTPATKKRSGDSLENLEQIDFADELRQFSERETKTPINFD